jgi:S1-C subfamily serine protease
MIQCLDKLEGALPGRGGSEPTRALKATTLSKKSGGSGSGFSIPSPRVEREAKECLENGGVLERRAEGRPGGQGVDN